MSLIKKTTDKTIKSIMKSFTGDTKFEFTTAELRTAVEACNILKEMSALPYEEGKKLQKNISIISPILIPLQDESNLIEGRREDINERARRATTQEQLDELKKDRSNCQDDTKTFNNKKHKVELYTIPEEQFIKGDETKEKFGVKKINQQNGQPPVEIERYPYFLELLGLGIITENQEKPKK